MELCSMLCAQCCPSLDGTGVWGRMDTCICMAESLHCSPETITTLLFGYAAAAAAAKSLQSCPTLCDLIDRSLPGSPVPGILQAKNTGVGCHFLLQCVKVKSEREVTQSCPTLATPWTAAYQAPPSMGFSRQEYWSGVPLPSPLQHTGIQNI